jgi:OOP family OmpA-OmpF porin
MKKHLIVTIALTFFYSALVTAQNAKQRWHLGLSFNVVDIYPTGTDADDPLGPQGKLFEDPFNVSDHWSFGGPTIYLSRSLIKGFSIGARASLNVVKKIEGVANPNYPYFAASGFLKQTFFSSKNFKPFITVGYGISDIDYGNTRKLELLSKNTSRNFNGGLGFDIQLSDLIGLSLESTFLSPTENFGVKHFRHQLGLYYAFGSKDSDKDGIPDKNDSCPEEPGLKEFNGCPDTDGDKIPDNKDNCPEEFGSEIMNGCPDSDQDGVADADDQCPQEKGLIALGGCPDRDEDGIADKDDECPQEKGVEENKGCPWPDSDEDGITDNIDSCPDEAGPEENNGCPEIATEIMKTINEIATQVNFMAGSDRIQGRAVIQALEDIKTLLNENPDGNLIIEGHTSSDGGAEDNLILSQKRADAVKAYLINKGINPNRLKTEGYGEERPIDDNNTREGRAINRRVQFKLDF